MAETRLALRAAAAVVRGLVPVVAWAAAAIGLGVLVGFAAVVLPPTGAFGIVAVVGVVLLWVIPEMPLVYPSLIRKAFLVMLVVSLCVPYYYMIQIGDLPWISAVASPRSRLSRHSFLHCRVRRRFGGGLSAAFAPRRLLLFVRSAISLWRLSLFLNLSSLETGSQLWLIQY
jgi:hypothetical protein